jgi:L-malate glycosyltransferase
MKLGIVCYPSVGGSGILATELGHQLALRGHDVHFITYERPFRLKPGPRIHFHEVEINHYDLFRYPDYALTLAVKIAQVAKEHQLDLVHVHYAIPHATSGYLARQMCDEKLAILTTLHGTDITLVGKKPAFQQIVKFSIEKSTGVTAVSHSLKNQTVEWFGIERPIDVIHDFFVPDPDSAPAQLVGPGQKLLLHASNFRGVKRVPDVIHTFAQVRLHVDAKLALIGEGSHSQEVRDLVGQLNLTDDVLFLGRLRDLDPYMAAADLFLLPSAQESFGLAALEAMAYGTPVIASNAGGLPELITPETGFLHLVGDTDGMAESALSLLTDETKLQQMSHAAQQRARNHFSAEAIVPQYEKLYRKLVG